MAKAVKKKFLIKLLVNQYTMRLLSKFLKNTEVENNDGRVKKENKWKQKRNWKKK